MYESFYGFKEKPFNLLPDPEYLYMSPGHENAYTHLEYAIKENKGFVVITGEIGSGKTTLINYLLKKIPQDIQVGIINNADVTPLQFIKMICQELELEVHGMDKAEMLDRFNRFLLEQFSKRNRVVLIIDEAQNLPSKTIEEIRMLSNLETEKNHLIQIILVGQPELRYKLQTRGLAQFAQRVTVHCHLDGLGQGDVKKYISHRLQVAGAKNLNIFDKGAIEAIYQYSHGVPRIINTLCDTALVYGYADDLKAIDKKIIENVFETREIGGIFFEDKETEQPSIPSPISDNGALKQLNSRLQSMEKRVLQLENVVAGMEQQFNLVLNSKEKKDDLAIELFKMLKQSMASRGKLTAKYVQLKLEMERNKGGAIEVKRKPKPSLFSRQKPKEVRKE
ncbi:MAG: AAA family ATPase [Deltaproteobacteria bacterium]|nr:AAA family ATPase [Deltaproteobacteria bacterium]